MSYKNDFFYNRDSSIDPKYQYVDASTYSPIYGSSVSFASRLNTLETVDNTLKILPASENNLNIKYTLKFLLNETDTGNLLKTIEIAGGYRYLKFNDPSGIYSNITGYVEDYNVQKNNNLLNDVTIILNSYFTAPLFKWKTSSLLNMTNLKTYQSGGNYNKYDVVYNSSIITSKNQIDNFWFAKDDIINAPAQFTQSQWSKQFIYEPKLPFTINNKLDIYQMNYKNSFMQNVKYKNNSNSLKSFSIKFENITDSQCFSMLLFLEKKCGYRRFVYNYPVLFNKYKVFISTAWSHNMKYKDCHEVDVTFIEDPNPSMVDMLVDN